jgi:hypothetical protein
MKSDNGQDCDAGLVQLKRCLVNSCPRWPSLASISLHFSKWKTKSGYRLWFPFRRITLIRRADVGDIYEDDCVGQRMKHESTLHR